MHFEVYRKKDRERADYISGTTSPKHYPCFELVHNYDWNDYAYNNWYSLWYFADSSTHTYVGDLKIMTRQQMGSFEAMGEEFEGGLDESFCSLGLDLRYYQRVRELFKGKRLDALMRGLRDCVHDPQIYEEFRDLSEFELSLKRDQSSQEALDNGKLFLMGLPQEKAYSFTFDTNLQIGQSTQDVKFRVNFPFVAKVYQRAMGIIGENGTGKTQLLSSLTESLINAETVGFDSVPIFNSCVVLSSTPYDRYPERTGNERIYYNYYSLEQAENKTAENLKAAINRINGRPVMLGKRFATSYVETMRDCVGDIIDKILIWIPSEKGEEEGLYQLDEDALEDAVEKMSSGHLHLFTLITYLYDTIHLSTLLIIDEPEVHLHPHTIVVFMKVLADVLWKFRSCAIIATHSPLIVREMINTNVQVLKNVDGDGLVLSPVAYATFGEDITTLYYNIFDYDIKDSFFTELISRKAKKRASYDSILNSFETDIKLGINARLAIRDLVEEKKEDNA